MPKTYQIKMYTVEAIQINAESVDRAALWCGGVKVDEYDPLDHTRKFAALNVPTMSGVKRAQQGDYVVKETGGEFRVISKHDFESKYEVVN